MDRKWIFLYRERIQQIFSCQFYIHVEHVKKHGEIFSKMSIAIKFAEIVQEQMEPVLIFTADST